MIALRINDGTMSRSSALVGNGGSPVRAPDLVAAPHELLGAQVPGKNPPGIAWNDSFHQRLYGPQSVESGEGLLARAVPKPKGRLSRNSRNVRDRATIAPLHGDERQKSF